MKLKNRGDTIIEVLIVLAILGLAIAISYATANGGVLQARNSEEHSEALGIISSQVEELRDYIADHPTFNPTHIFYMSNLQPVTCTSGPSNPCVANATSAYPQTIKIRPPITAIPANNFYDFTITWPGVGNLGPQSEELDYIIFPINGS